MQKSLLNLPHRYAIGRTGRLGLIERACIVWEKVNGIPSSARDRSASATVPVEGGAAGLTAALENALADAGVAVHQLRPRPLPAVRATCPGCSVEMPLTGVCDYC